MMGLKSDMWLEGRQGMTAGRRHVRAFSRTARVLPPARGDWFPVLSVRGAAHGGLLRACRVLVLAEDEAAPAQGGGAGDDHGQRQGLAGQGGRAGLDVLAEQE